MVETSGGAPERDWGDLEALPPQKSAFPRWLWFCGGGCLVMLLLVLAAGWWTVDWVRDGMDSDSQWERLAEILPYDERTEDHELQFGGKVPFIDCEVFMFVPTGFVERAREEQAESDPDADLDPGTDADADEEVELVETEPDEDGEEPGDDRGDDGGDDRASRTRARASLFVAVMHFSTGEEREPLDELGGGDAERFDLRVQGLDLPAYRTEGSGPAFPGMPADSQSSVLVVLPSDPSDPSDAGDAGDRNGSGNRQTILVFVRQGSTEPVAEAEITEFLAPFHVGPDR